MKVEFEPAIQERKPLLDLISNATSTLEDAIGEPADRVTATWGFKPDSHGQPVFRVTIADSLWSSSASAEFTVQELQTPSQLTERFRQLWRNSLDQAMRRQLKILESYELEGAVT